MTSGQATAANRWGHRARWELLALIATLGSYSWLWQGRFVGAEALVAVLTLTVVLSAHRARRESARELGFRLDNLAKALRLVLTFTAPLLALVVLTGLGLGLARELPAPLLPERVLSALIFGVAQQYVLQGVLLRRFGEVWTGPWRPIVAAASTFALLHTPALWLVGGSFAVGLGACWLYRQAPNLWVLGAAHGALSVTVALFLSDLLPMGLKVGLRALG